MATKKRKKSTKELTLRLILYIVCAAALCIGFGLFVHNQSAAEKQEAEEAAAAAAVPTETPVPTPVVTPPPVLEKEELSDEEQIANCFSNLGTLSGAEEFESLGGYVAPEELQYNLRSEIQKIENGGFSIGFILMDIPTGKGIAYNSQEEYYSASSVKGPYMVSLIAHEKDVLDEWGDIIEEIAHTSDNGCYNQLYRNFGSDYYNDWCDQAEASAYMYNDYQYTYYSPEGLARLWMLN